MFVCLKDKTCLRAEGGQGDDGACCSAAGAFVVLSRASGHRPWLPWLLCGAPFEGGRPEPMLRRSASRGSAPLYFVRSRLGVVTEGIFCPWSAVSSRATQASAFRQAWGLVPGTAINRGRGVSSSSPASQLFLPAFCLNLVMFPLPFRDRPPDGVAWFFFRPLVLEECLRAAGEDRSGRALHPPGSVGSAEEHWARGVMLPRCPLA